MYAAAESQFFPVLCMVAACESNDREARTMKERDLVDDVPEAVEHQVCPQLGRQVVVDLLLIEHGLVRELVFCDTDERTSAIVYQHKSGRQTEPTTLLQFCTP